MCKERHGAFGLKQALAMHMKHGQSLPKSPSAVTEELSAVPKLTGAAFEEPLVVLKLTSAATEDPSAVLGTISIDETSH